MLIAYVPLYWRTAMETYADGVQATLLYFCHLRVHSDPALDYFLHLQTIRQFLVEHPCVLHDARFGWSECRVKLLEHIQAILGRP
jgi:hypothetical protein